MQVYTYVYMSIGITYYHFLEQPFLLKRSFENCLLRLQQDFSDGKESAYNMGDLGLILGSERFPEEESGYPLQYSCLENSMDRGA